MKRPTTIVLALMLATAMVAMPLAAADVGAVSQEDSDDEQGPDDGPTPGEQLSGVIGVQEAEFDGEIAERTYGIAVASAATDDARADVVGDQFADVEERIDALEDRAVELEDARDAGELSQGEYEARMATVATEKATAERLANGTAATADGLDDELLAERGIDADAIETLTDRAGEIGGPEIADIARSIAGESAGQPVDVDRDPGAPIDRPGADGADDADEGDDSDADETDETEDDETAADDDRGQTDTGSQ